MTADSPVGRSAGGPQTVTSPEVSSGLPTTTPAVALAHDSVGIFPGKKAVLALGEGDLDRRQRSLESGNGLFDRLDNASDPFTISCGCDLACGAFKARLTYPSGAADKNNVLRTTMKGRYGRGCREHAGWIWKSWKR